MILLRMVCGDSIVFQLGIWKSSELAGDGYVLVE